MNKVVSYNPTANKTELVVTLETEEKRLLNIDYVVKLPFLTETDKTLWKNMVKANHFISRLELDHGVLVWKGWCEIFPEDIYEYTTEYTM